MNTPGVLGISSMKDKCTPAEWQARVDLAACYRLVEMYGMADMMANHISSHVPGEPGAFLINPYGMMYEEMTASSLIKVDAAGNILSKPDFGELDYGINKAGYVIHSAVHAALPDVACVIHTHSWASMAVSSLACGLLPITQTAMRFLKVGYHDYQGVVLNTEEQASLLADLGDREAVIFRNHGAPERNRPIISPQKMVQPRRHHRAPHRARDLHLRIGSPQPHRPTGALYPETAPSQRPGHRDGMPALSRRTSSSTAFAPGGNWAPVRVVMPISRCRPFIGSGSTTRLPVSTS